MSVRVSAGRPSTCSGAMYGSVPTTRPVDGQGPVPGRQPRQRVFRRFRSDCPGEAEVEELHARLRQHDVRGLEVPVDDPAAVRRVERPGDLRAVTQRLLERQWPSRESRLERLAFDQLHDEDVARRRRGGSGRGRTGNFFERIEGGDPGMVQAREQLRLALEAPSPLFAFKEFFRQYLQRHRPVDAGVPRPVDLPHAALAERGEDLVGAEAGSGVHPPQAYRSCVTARGGRLRVDLERQVLRFRASRTLPRHSFRCRTPLTQVDFAKIHVSAATQSGMARGGHDPEAQAEIAGRAHDERRKNDEETERDFFESEEGRGCGGAAPPSPNRTPLRVHRRSGPLRPIHLPGRTT